MNVTLTSELERLVQRRVRKGFYASRSEVVREALRQMFEVDEEYVTAQLEAAAKYPDEPLTRDELQSVRQIVTKARASKTPKKAPVS